MQLFFAKFSIILTIVILLSISLKVRSEETDQDKKDKVLSSLKYGKEILFLSDFNGPEKGIVIRYDNDSLYLGAPKLKPNITRRRMNYKPRLENPKWIPVQSRTVLPYHAIREIHTHGNAMVTGGIIGGSIFCVVSFLFLLVVEAFDDMSCSPSFDCGTSDEFTTTEFIAGMTIGTSVGILAGGFLGSLFPKWKLRYRDSGFSHSMNEVTLSPYLTLETHPNDNESIALDINDVKVQIGFNINW